MKLLDRIAQVSDRNFWLLFTLAVLFSVFGFLLHSDFAMDESPFVTSYSLSLGADCETNIKKCHMAARPLVGYRVETTRNEVVAMMPDLAGLMAKYDNCIIWDTSNWQCEQGRIEMREGVLQNNVFEPDKGVYYVPKTAWKLAKMHILPLSSVRHAPPPPRSRGT